MVVCTDAKVNGEIKKLVILGDTIYISGYFESVGGQRRSRLAALSAVTGQVLPWIAMTGFPVGAMMDINPIAATDGHVYFGGTLWASPSREAQHFLLALDPKTGNLLDWHPNPSGYVRELAVYNNTLFVIGEFADIGGRTRNGLATLDLNSGDATDWNPAILGSVLAFAFSGDTIYIGGDFSSIGGKTQMFLAALDLNTANLTSWYPKADGWVNYISVVDKFVFVSGGFHAINGAPSIGMAELDIETGSPTNFRPSVTGSIRDIVVLNDAVFIAGYLGAVNGLSRNNLVEIDSVSGNPTDWNPDADGAVTALTISGNIVYAGGSFVTVGGKVRRNFAAINADTGHVSEWVPHAELGGSNVWVATLAVSPVAVYASVKTQSADNVVSNELLSLDVTSGNLTGWHPKADNTVYAIVIAGDAAYVGGAFTSVNGLGRNHLAALDSVSGAVTAWNPDIGGDVGALTLSGTTLYVGGHFASAMGKTRNNLAAMDIGTGKLSKWDPNVDSPDIEPWNSDGLRGFDSSMTWVKSIFAVNGIVYIGGNYSSIGGQPRLGVSAVDSEIGIPTDWHPSVYASFGLGSYVFTEKKAFVLGSVYQEGKSRDFAVLDTASVNPSPRSRYANGNILAMAKVNNTLFVGGEFTSIASKSRRYLAALDAVTANPTAWDPDANGSITSIAVSGSIVYVAGKFTFIGGQERHGLAALDVKTGLATTWNPEPDGEVRTLAFFDGVIYVGGGFGVIGGQLRNNLAAFETSTGNATDWNPNANAYVNTLRVANEQVYVSGRFSTIGEKERQRLAALDIRSGAVMDWNPKITANGEGLAVAAVNTSTVYVTGSGFSAPGHGLTRHIALDATTGAVIDSVSDRTDFIFAFATLGNTTYVGGQFDRFGGQDRVTFAAFNSMTGSLTNWNPRVKTQDNPYFDLFQTPTVILPTSEAIYIAGEFFSHGKVLGAGLAIVNLDGSLR